MKHEMGWARVNGVVQRRRWPVIFTALLVTALGMLLVKQMPRTYQARTVVRLNDPRPAREYINPIVNEPTGERLSSARAGFLAQPVVVQAAEKADLLPAGDPGERGKRLAIITARLDARLEGDDTFVITFEDSDPEKASLFLTALVEAHGQRRAVEMSERATATAAYMAKQIEEMRPRVADAEAKVEKYRLENYGALPDQLEGNLRILDENEMTMNALIASLDAAHSRRRDVLADVQSPLRRQEEEVARDLSAARTRFASGAPEVKALEEELARVRADRHSDEGTAAKRIKSSSEMRNVEDQIARLTGQISELKTRGAELRNRIDASARNGEVIARMSLERDVMRERFRSLVGKHEEAALSAGLEAGVAGAARVTVLEPAWSSSTPVKPSKPLFALIALALGAAAGIGLGFIIDTLDRRVLAADDVRALTGDLPILAVVPRLSRSGRAANSNSPDVHAVKAAGRAR